MAEDEGDDMGRKVLWEKVGRVVGILLAAVMVVTGGYGIYERDFQTVAGSGLLIAIASLIIILSRQEESS